MKVDAARVDIANLTLMDLMRIAYDVKPYQIVGPEWMRGGERWNVLAKLPDGALQEQVPAMLRALLEERFKLAVNKEPREHSIYALLVGKNGPKMKEADEGGAPSGPEPAADHSDQTAAGRGQGMTMPV